MIEGEFEAHVERVLDNLRAVLEAAGASLDSVVRTNVFLTDLGHFALLNKIMAEYFEEPFPARAAIGVASLPRGAQVEMDCIAELE